MMTNIAGKGLLLLSGGFDSPVAGHLMKQQGLDIDAIHFSLEPVTDDAAEKKCMELARIVGFRKVYVAKVGEVFTKIASSCSHRFYFVLSKRLMVRVAEAVARRDGYSFLVTGENLGQVSSQTLQNLTVIDNAAKIPVLRPLLGFDKQEIISVAKKLGTYETSKGPEICDALGPDKPSTAATLPEILQEETNLNGEGLVEKVVGNLEERAIPPPAKAAGKKEAAG
jgi:thiamine biosynthesis protein ThiI